MKSSCDDTKELFLEMVIFLSLISCLPGLFMKIEGGSALYFYIPVYFLGWIIFVGTETLDSIGEWLRLKKHIAEVTFLNEETIVYKLNLLVFLILFVSIPLTFIHDINIYSIMKTTVATRIDATHFRKEFKNKLTEFFHPVKTISDKNYIMFNEINCKTQNMRQDYCIYISDNSLINRYDYFTKARKDRKKYLYGNLAITAYLGLPIINSIYIRDNIFYRGDMLKLGKYEEIAGYTMPPIICGERVTKDNMMDVAKRINKKKIIILNNNNYEILNVQ